MIRVHAEVVKNSNSAVAENSDIIKDEMGVLKRAPITICKNKYGKCGDA